MMKTVIEFVPRLSDGGAQSLICSYAEAIDRNIISLVVLTVFPNLKSAMQEMVLNSNVPVISLYPHYNFFYRVIHKLFGRYITTFLLKRKLLQIRPCAIHVHMALLKYLEPIKSKLNNVRLFYTCHSLPKYYLSEHSEKTAAQRLIRNNNLQVIALHKEMKVALDCLLGINNSIIIKNGINIRKFQNVSEGKQEIRQTLDILPEQFVVGHVGRFSEVKNHEFILDVFNQILKYKDAHLILIGNGVLLPVIKFKIKRLGLEKQVTILTHRSDINRLLKAMDVFFFPSLFEGFGIALLEAQAAGLRCVISDTIPDVVRVLDSTVAVSLSMPAEYWCNIIIDDSITQPHTATLEEYDIVPIVKQLQKMYIG